MATALFGYILLLAADVLQNAFVKSIQIVTATVHLSHLQLLLTRMFLHIVCKVICKNDKIQRDSAKNVGETKCGNGFYFDFFTYIQVRKRFKAV